LKGDFTKPTTAVKYFTTYNKSWNKERIKGKKEKRTHHHARNTSYYYYYYYYFGTISGNDLESRAKAVV
jgi:hypothetical protein